MEKTFGAVAEDRPGRRWQRAFADAWPRVRPWYLRDGLDARPTVAQARAAMQQHVPELVPVYDTLCRLAGDDGVAHRMLAGGSSRWAKQRGAASTG